MLHDALEAIKTALVAALPARVVTRDLLSFDQRAESDLQAGVLTIIASREGNYANYRGREAQLGKLSVACVGQLKLAESAAPSAVESAEFAFAEEVKGFLQAVLPVEAVVLLETRFSGQLEAPYGWFAMDWEVWP
jgi:hypothetical protein